MDHTFDDILAEFRSRVALRKLYPNLVDDPAEQVLIEMLHEEKKIQSTGANDSELNDLEHEIDNLVQENRSLEDERNELQEIVDRVKKVVA